MHRVEPKPTIETMADSIGHRAPSMRANAPSPIDHRGTTMSRTSRKSADRIAVASLGSSFDAAPGPSLGAQGPKGSIQFFIQSNPGGLYVERDECPADGVRTIQSLSFTTREQFMQWCDDDPVRFDHPLLHDRLKRAAIKLWNDGPAPDP